MQRAKGWNAKSRMKLVRILLPIDQGGTSEACARAAFVLADRFKAELEVLHPCLAAWQRLPYATELSPLYFQELIATGAEQVAFEKGQAKAWVDKIVIAYVGVEARFTTIEGLIGPSVAARARVADFTVLPTSASDEDTFWASTRDAALFDSGKPLLVVPKDAGDFGEIVTVAWKDNAEATRAVTAARPFLATAKRVRLIAINEDEENGDQSLAAMAAYLDRSGFDIESARIDGAGRDVGAVLLEAATVPGGMLVMGAYGHRRWKEWAFGGVTQHVLRAATVPVLMMH
jgi:nucleotide-binding universal stress UspA family protein